MPSGQSVQKTFQTALAHHQAGRLPQAEALYRQVLQSGPGHPDTLHLLGMIARQTGRLDRAYSLTNREYARLMHHWRSVLPTDRFLEVPYEALVDDPAGWSRRIIEFIGLDWDERCLEFHKTERKVGTASNWQVRQKIYSSSKARWRRYEKYITPLLGLLDLDPS